MKEIFEKDIEIRKVKLEKFNKISNILGFFKIAMLIFIGYGIFLWIKNGYSIGLIVLLVFEVALFITAHLYHRVVFSNIALESGIIKINNDNLDRLSGDWRNFEDIGEEFIDVNHNYGVDLDIVGRKSIFQMLNSTNTCFGREIFASDLLNPKYNNEEIEVRQYAIKEISEDYPFSSKVEYFFSKVGVDNSFKKLIDDLENNEKFISNKILYLVSNYMWIITAIFIIVTVITRSKYAFFISLGLIAIQTIYSLIYFGKAAHYFGIMGTLPRKLFKYDDAINEIIKKNFESKKLQEIQSEIKSAKKGINELYSIADSINRYQYGVAHFLANILFLKDIKNAIRLSNWKSKYSLYVRKWFVSLGEFESIVSFSNLPRVCNNTSIPNYYDSKNYLDAKKLGHPLILNENRVSNDFKSNNNVFIISGSNMSGKTTFMRTIGINLVLARAGSFVCAESMNFSNMDVVTSMRIIDDLNEGISTFYAELKRIKMIIDLAHSNENTMFLIDEIFRGTNSVDRLKGAEEVLKELCTTNVSGLITTHDLQVCDLESEFNNIINLSFSENFKEDEMYFDYKLKNGKSKTTNAEYLLKKVGIIKK